MRIAFFSTLTNTPWGGSEVLWSNVAVHLVKEGHQIAAFLQQWEFEPEKVSQLRTLGVEIFYYAAFQKNNSIIEKLAKRIQQQIRINELLLQPLFKWRPDFIFFNQGHSYDIGYYTDGQLKPLLATTVPFAFICQNNTDYNFIPAEDTRKKIKQLYKKANKVFFVSKRNKETAEMVICESIPNAEIISNSTSLIGNKVGILPFLNSKEIQFACVARLRCSHKGQNILLHILSQQKWLQRNWKLNLYGTGEDEQFLKQLTAYFKLNNRVVFHGQKSDIHNVWLNNHILLLASFGEGMPLALQEAMLCGRPAMVTDVGGNAELIEDGITGWLANGTTFTAIDAAMERAWMQQDSWQKIGEQAYEKVTNSIDLSPEFTLSEYCIAAVNNKSAVV